MPKPIYLIFLFIFSPVYGQGQPADFKHSEEKRRLENLIIFPEISGNISVIMSCFSRIQTNGKMKDTGCYLKNNYDGPFQKAVSTGARKARMNPALIGGKAREIFLQFLVGFKQEKEEQTISFYLNPGYPENIKAYGSSHIAGQRAINKNETWNSACPKRARWAVYVKTYLGADGIADVPSIQHIDGVVPVAACQNAIKQTIRMSQYTPAFADGVAVPSTFVEPFSN